MVLFVCLLAGVSHSPSVSAQNSPVYTIHTLEGVSPSYIYPGGSVLFGPGADGDDGDTYQGGGKHYYAYGYDDGSYHVYVEIRINGTCGSTVHVPASALEHIADNPDDITKTWTVTWQDVYEDKEDRYPSLSGNGDEEILNCRVYERHPDGKEKRDDLLLRFDLEKKGIDDISSLEGSGHYMVALESLNGGSEEDIILTTWAGNNFAEVHEDRVSYTYEQPTPYGPLYREQPRGVANPCGSFIYLSYFEFSDLKDKRIIQGAWNDVKDDDCLDIYSGGDDKNERQIFIVNHNFEGTPCGPGETRDSGTGDCVSIPETETECVRFDGYVWYSPPDNQEDVCITESACLFGNIYGAQKSIEDGYCVSSVITTPCGPGETRDSGTGDCVSIPETETECVRFDGYVWYSPPDNQEDVCITESECLHGNTPIHEWSGQSSSNQKSIEDGYCLSSVTTRGTSIGASCTPDCSIFDRFNQILNLMAMLVVPIVTIVIIIGGVQYSTSAGSPDATKAAKTRMINGVTALIAFMFMWAILKWLIPGDSLG